ncbi:MAG: hypothetical protein KME17_18795 [Cyanosarcina radialis HA8281-LM2]|nr:hypothetical protein [Cyanosarcina radialis HA8281-LM2]
MIQVQTMAWGVGIAIDICRGAKLCGGAVSVVARRRGLECRTQVPAPPPTQDYVEKSQMILAIAC